MLGCKPAELPIESNHKLEAEIDEMVDKGRYQRLVGRMIYVAHTRPDIAYAVSLVICTEAKKVYELYCTFVGGNLVTWRSKKQIIVTRSSAEAKYRAMAQGVCELLWLQKVLEELKLLNKNGSTLYCDNKAAISIAQNLMQHDRIKLIKIDCHFIKKKVVKWLI
ncbi:Retrovirus-related Pol polyprotein from transposon TNT 1-94 [Gossypium australe]|uniref:Retrovirus-related Pol polyprotein from transposon TNT 1-94 n=1 Tax=Gossypium australe TaxID=47621 RepID=A0A5B6WQF6_9ROSI|nr:Retrovirus-related Pol polyprotein from transposon TNT 1-94 [Gossypium australe]